jgi:hypothetical protein
MILWTIQKFAAWEKLYQDNFLWASQEHILEEFCPAYRWMKKQMAQRIGPPPQPDSYPLWAWHEWQGRRRKKPDLRSGGHLAKGEEGVRIEFEIDETNVLLSDFSLWHHVLNYWYLPSSEKDDREFEAELQKQGLSFFKQKPLPYQKYHRLIEKSWERIFDLDWQAKNYTDPIGEKSIQAAFWELRLDQVKECFPFTAR